MGISGLHPVLKPYLQQSRVAAFQGRRLGVDAWSWLHRGAVGAARELATGERPWEQQGRDPPWVSFCLKMALLVRSAGATPVLVFDGCRLPAKTATNAQRRQRRSEARERALQLLREGREAEAQGALVQCIDVTADMAQQVMVKLRERGIEFVVAPYEADAQLAHLASIPERDGGVAAVVTEDSDLVGYGCRRILFKLDTNGYCWELDINLLFAGPPPAAPPGAAAAGSAGSSRAAASGSQGGGSKIGGSQGGSKGGKGGGSVLSFKGWTLEMLQAACVLAGCDFLPSLQGISFRTAAGFVGRRRSLEGALRAIRLEKRFACRATAEYCAAAGDALAAFKHALVFCHNTAGGSLRRLTPVLPSQQQQGQQQEQSASVAGAAASADEPAAAAGGSEGQAGAQAEAGAEAEAGAQAGGELPHLGAILDADVARGLAYGYLRPNTLQPFSPAHADPQQWQPSIHGRRQLGSWMVGAAHGAGLGPAPHRSQQEQQQQQQQQQRWGRPRGQGQGQGQGQGGQRASWMQQAQAQPPRQQRQDQQAGTHARSAGQQWQQQQPAPPQQQQQAGSASVPARASDPLALATAGPSSQAGSASAVGSGPGQAAPATQASCLDGSTPLSRPAMQAITNLQQQVSQQALAQSQQHSSSGTATGGAAVGGISVAASGSPAGQAPPPVWDAADQFRPQASQQQARAMSPARAAASAGGKRKSGGGGTGAKKARPLAPPAQRISRFFQPAGKQP